MGLAPLLGGPAVAPCPRRRTGAPARGAEGNTSFLRGKQHYAVPWNSWGDNRRGQHRRGDSQGDARALGFDDSPKRHSPGRRGQRDLSTTTDLDAGFPALAARQLGWFDAALLCGHELTSPVRSAAASASSCTGTPRRRPTRSFTSTSRRRPICVPTARTCRRWTGGNWSSGSPAQNGSPGEADSESEPTAGYLPDQRPNRRLMPGLLCGEGRGPGGGFRLDVARQGGGQGDDRLGHGRLGGLLDQAGRRCCGPRSSCGSRWAAARRSPCRSSLPPSSA